MAGTLLLVATPIGNLEDITLRALRALREADLIAAEDTRRTAKLLAHFGITTKTVSLHQHSNRKKVSALIERVRTGAAVAVVTDAGMPVISDPGAELIREAVSAGIKVEIIPGASALTMAIAGASFEADLTTFAGFPPSRAGERRRWLAGLAQFAGAVVLFEAPHRLRQTLEDVQASLGNRPIVVAHELTKLHESWHRGSASELLANPALPEKGEFTIVIGPSSGVGEIPPTPDSETLWHEFGRLTNSGARTRKEAIAELAERYRRPKREIYALVEAAKGSGE